MAFGLALIIIIAVTAIGWVLTKGRSKRRKWIVWGLLIMIGLSPFVSWLIGIGIALMIKDAFAGIGVMAILFISLFFIGTICLIIGLCTKENIEQASPK